MAHLITEIGMDTPIQWTMTPEMHAYAERLIEEEERARHTPAKTNPRRSATRAPAIRQPQPATAHHQPPATTPRSTISQPQPPMRQPSATVNCVADGAQPLDSAEIIVLYPPR